MVHQLEGGGDSCGFQKEVQTAKRIKKTKIKEVNKTPISRETCVDQGCILVGLVGFPFADRL